MNRRFMAIAADPRVIPGVHHYCDEWCDHCPVTSRCLAFRCTEDWRKQRNRGPDEPPFASMHEIVTFTRQVAEVEGLKTDELDALLAGGPASAEIDTQDPLAEIAWTYAVGAAALLAQVSSDPPAGAVEGEPPPLEIVAWYHLRIFMKLFRALVARERIAAGKINRTDEALGNAKLALQSVRRSRAALPALIVPATAVTVARLEGLLGAIEAGIDERFPDARAFVRIGLDVPVAA